MMNNTCEHDVHLVEISQQKAKTKSCPFQTIYPPHLLLSCPFFCSMIFVQNLPGTIPKKVRLGGGNPNVLRTHEIKALKPLDEILPSYIPGLFHKPISKDPGT